MKKYFIVIGIVFSVLSACKKDLQQVYKEQEVLVKLIELPDSIQLGNQMNVKTICLITNGCGRISRYTLDEVTDTSHLVFYAKYPVDVTCANGVFEDSTYFAYTTKRRGMYYFVLNPNGASMFLDSILIY